MITIVEENVYRIECSEYQKQELLQFAASRTNPETLVFLLYDKEMYQGALTVSDLLENRTGLPYVIVKRQQKYTLKMQSENEWRTVQDSEDFFLLARFVFRKNGWDNQVLAVQNEAGDCEFLLHYEANRIYGEKKEGCFYDAFWQMDEESLSMDTDLISRYDSFVCFAYNEYTAYLGEMMKQRYPDKQVIYLDEKASKYGKDSYRVVQNESSLHTLLPTLGRVAYIASDYENEYGPVKRYLTGVYSSLNIMKSLLWCAKTTCLGEKNPKRKILLLDFDVQGCGLVDLMKFTAEYCELARKRGMIPVVDYKDHQGYFTNDETQNVWTLFFNPVSEISVREARESQNVVIASENGMRLVDWEMNPYIYEEDCKIWDQAFDMDSDSAIVKNCNFLDEICERGRWTLPKEFHEKQKILGVIARGTDYRKEAVAARGMGDYVRNKEVELFILECEQKMAEGGFDYLYLATEDQDYLEAFQKVFGSQLLFHEQKRAKLLKENETKLVSEMLKSKEPTEQVKQYCNVLWALSSCEELMTSMNCGAYLAALVLKTTK